MLWDNNVNMLIKVPWRKPKIPILPLVDPTLHYPYYYGKPGGGSGIGGSGMGAE